MKIAGYLLIALLFIKVGCNNNSKTTNNVSFQPNICSCDSIIKFNIYKLNNDTINIRVKKKNRLVSDGFKKKDSVFLFPKVFSFF